MKLENKLENKLEKPILCVGIELKDELDLLNLQSSYDCLIQDLDEYLKVNAYIDLSKDSFNNRVKDAYNLDNYSHQENLWRWKR
jgi:hypothetical protein